MNNPNDVKSETDSSNNKKRKRRAEKDQGDAKKLKNSASGSRDVNDEINVSPQWRDYELLSEQLGLSLHVSKNVTELFEDGNTIPFIARYRKNLTENMTPEELRLAKETCEEITTLKSKIASAMKNLQKSNSLNEELKYNVTASRTVEELEYIYAPYKPGNKRTLAERAKELGLEPPALAVLHNRYPIQLSDYIREKELLDPSAVEKGIVHIIASIIATDAEIMSSIRDLRKKSNFQIHTKKTSSKGNADKTKGRDCDRHKFDNYMDFETSVKHVKPHQILAINRAECLKILSVKIVVPETFFHDFQKLCSNKWLKNEKANELRRSIITQAIEDSYKRLVEPLIKREIRSELKQKAERASCEVFSGNLKHLLLAAPIKGRPILGIDPGYTNGCKLALVSPMGDLIASDTIYPHVKDNRSKRDSEVLKKLLVENNCELIALGNGTACRQTEEWLTELIAKKTFQPLDVRFTIVREDGASIYSCSAKAKHEFPDLDPNIISAVSLARRIQDPLAELVKVEPKHLGIGMYQHDIKKKQLEEALNDVISECVSFVGVDLNTASYCLLKHVAGLTEKKAQKILDFRGKKGPFICRNQLLEVNGIGQKIFQQCAGFLRVGPSNAEESELFYRNKKATKLDCTSVHPESYDVALQLLSKLDLKLSHLGEKSFITAFKCKVEELKLSELQNEFNCDEATISLILEALSKTLNYDLRSSSPKEPIFKKDFTTIEDVRSGSVLTGVISNVTHFGCFVDIGVGVNGLVHVSKYKGLNPQVGDRIEVKVISVEITKKRIQLEALKLC